MTRLSLVAVLCAAVVLPRDAVAQRSGAQWVLEGTFGRSAGSGGGVRRERDGTAIDGLLMSRARRRSGIAHLVLAFGGGLEGPSNPETCLALPGSGCVPDFPRIYSFGLFVGAEHSGRFGDVRLLAGPTHYRVDGGGSSLGGQARLEVATPSAFDHVALVASARGGLVSNLDRQSFRLAAIGIGLAVH